MDTGHGGLPQGIGRQQIEADIVLDATCHPFPFRSAGVQRSTPNVQTESIRDVYHQLNQENSRYVCSTDVTSYWHYNTCNLRPILSLLMITHIRD